MPFPNEHAARINQPKKYKQIRRVNDKFGKGVHAIFGILGEGKERRSELQAIRFDKDKFSPKQAKKWLKEHDHKPVEFEKATTKRKALDFLVKQYYQPAEDNRYTLLERRIRQDDRPQVLWDLHVAGIGAITLLGDPATEGEKLGHIDKEGILYATDRGELAAQSITLGEPPEGRVSYGLLSPQKGSLELLERGKVGIARKTGTSILLDLEGDTLKGQYKLLKSGDNWTWEKVEQVVSKALLYRKILEAVVKHRSRPASVWKAKDGSMWYVAIVSKAVRDREGELVTKEGRDYSIALSRKYGIHSKLHVGHIVPQTRIGKAVYETGIGPLWVEVGKFDKGNWLAERVFERLASDEEGVWRKLSIGFLTPKAQVRKGKYTRLLKYDTSVVDKPACPSTKIVVSGGSNDMSEEIMKLLDPEDDAERKKFQSALAELLGGKEKSLATVEKKKSPMGKFAEYIEGMEDGDVKKMCSAVKEYVEGLENGGMEDEEVPPAKKKKEEESDLRAELTDAVKVFSDRITALESTVKTMGEQVELAKALADVMRSMPKEEAAVRPTQDAPTVDANAVEELAKSMGLNNEAPAHPLSHFAGAPGQAEGGKL